MSHVAYLGTGLLGTGMIESALSRGDEVTVWNRSHAKAEVLEKLGAKVAATAGDAVRNAERVHIVLKDDESVDEVLAACRERLQGSLLLDHTTTSPAGTKLRAEALAEQGIEYLHAPVFMSPGMAKKAQGVVLASGPQKIFEKAKPALEKMGSSVQYLGERPDVAAAYKLFGNAMIITMSAGLADVFALARAQGVEPGDVMKMFDYFNPGTSLHYRGDAMARGKFEAGFEMTMARKDVRLMIEATAGGDVPLQLLPVIASWMDRLIAEGHGRLDFGALARDVVVGREPPPPSRARLPPTDN